MIETPIEVIIGGMTYLCPPMPFYCLERAWPHIQTLSKMGAANQALVAAELRLRNAVTPAEQDAASAALSASMTQVETLGADFVGQTREVLHVIVAALALSVQPPSYAELASLARPSEIAGVHVACTALMEMSGLMARASGEAAAITQMPAQLNGQGLSPSLRHTA